MSKINYLLIYSLSFLASLSIIGSGWYLLWQLNWLTVILSVIMAIVVVELIKQQNWFVVKPKLQWSWHPGQLAYIWLLIHLGK